MQSTTEAVVPTTCHDCRKSLRWVMKNTKVGTVGVSFCCTNSFIYRNDNLSQYLPQRPQPVQARRVASKSRLIFPLVCIAAVAILPLILADRRW